MRRVPIDELPALAREVRARLEALQPAGSATLVFLQGELGAGKTTFMQALGKEFGIAQTLASPTYVLMKTYGLAGSRFTTLVHIDAYRLERPEALAALQPEVFLRDPGALVCVEWPERAQGALPKPDLTLTFSHKDAGALERYIEII